MMSPHYMKGEAAEEFYNQFVEELRQELGHGKVKAGDFGVGYRFSKTSPGRTIALEA